MQIGDPDGVKNIAFVTAHEPPEGGKNFETVPQESNRFNQDIATFFYEFSRRLFNLKR